MPFLFVLGKAIDVCEIWLNLKGGYAMIKPTFPLGSVGKIDWEGLFADVSS